jgi:hypothetical protein
MGFDDCIRKINLFLNGLLEALPFIGLYIYIYIYILLLLLSSNKSAQNLRRQGQDGINSIGLCLVFTGSNTEVLALFCWNLVDKSIPLC